LSRILLIYPPFALPAGPPLGICSLASFLRKRGVEVTVLDLNVEAYEILLSRDFPTPPPQDTFSKRSLSRLEALVKEFKSPSALNSFSNYVSLVRHLERVLWLRSEGARAPRISFTNFKHPILSPLRTKDLVKMAERPDLGPVGERIMDRAISEVKVARPHWVGLSVQFLGQALPAMAIAGAIKRDLPHIRIAMGGGLVTSWHRLGKNPDLRPWIDRVIPGRGYLPLAQLMGVDGDMEDPIPAPDFSQLSLKRYFSPETIVPFSTSWGCHWGRCRFCPEAEGASTFMTIDPREVPGRIAQVAQKSDSHWIHIMDNAIPPPVLLELSRSKLGVRWFGFSRMEPLLAEPKVARGLYESGCRMLKLGLESGSTKILRILRKGTRVDVAKRVLFALHEAGIATYVYVLLGIPGETIEDARKTAEFLLENHEAVDFIHPSILNLPRRERELRGLKLREFPGRGEEDLSLYVDFHGSDGMDRKGARNFLKRELERNELLRALIKRDPPSFGSNHAPLLGKKVPSGKPFEL
jgi:hypothetical protein